MVHSCCCKWQSFPSLCDWIIFLLIVLSSCPSIYYLSQFLYLVSNCHSVVSLPCHYINNAVRFGVWVFKLVLIFITEKYPEVELLDISTDVFFGGLVVVGPPLKVLRASLGAVFKQGSLLIVIRGSFAILVMELESVACKAINCLLHLALRIGLDRDGGLCL